MSLLTTTNGTEGLLRLVSTIMKDYYLGDCNALQKLRSQIILVFLRESIIYFVSFVLVHQVSEVPGTDI